MNKIYTVIRKEYLERVRSKSFVIATLLGPAIMSLFILLPMLLSDTGKDEERIVELKANNETGQKVLNKL